MTTTAAAALTGELSRSMSIGFEKIEIQTLNIVSGDTGSTITAQTLSRVDFALVCGDIPVLTAQPTYSGNTCTLAWTDPVASKFAQVVLFGK